MVNVKPVKLGSNTRIGFSKIDEVWKCKQLKFKRIHTNRFLQEGLKKIFRMFRYYKLQSNNLVLDFVNYKLDDKPNYSVEDKERDATYAAALRVNARY